MAAWVLCQFSIQHPTLLCFIAKLPSEPMSMNIMHTWCDFMDVLIPYAAREWIRSLRLARANGKWLSKVVVGWMVMVWINNPFHRWFGRFLEFIYFSFWPDCWWWGIGEIWPIKMCEFQQLNFIECKCVGRFILFEFDCVDRFGCPCPDADASWKSIDHVNQ